MIFEYMQKALEKAVYKRIENGSWFAEIPELDGVWANSNTVEGCRKELLEVIEGWLILKIRDGDPIPELDELKIRLREEIKV